MSAIQHENEKRFSTRVDQIMSSPTYHAVGSIAAVIKQENESHFAKYCECIDPLSPLFRATESEIDLLRLKLSEMIRQTRGSELYTDLCDDRTLSFTEQHAGKTVRWEPNQVLASNSSLERVRKLMENRAASVAVSKYDGFVDKVENMILTLVSLFRCDSFADVGIEIIKYVKTLVPTSLLHAAHMLVNEHLAAMQQYFTLEQQSSGDTIPFITKFKNFLREWKNNREGPLSEHFCNLVSLLTILNVVPAPSGEEGNVSGLVQKSTGHEFLVNGYRIFSAKVLDVQKDALDVVELGLQTLLFFVERGYRAFETGDPSAMLHTDSELVKLDHEYAVLVSAVPLIESGRLSQLRDPHVKSIRDENDYCRRLDALIKTLTDASRVSDIHAAARSSLAGKITELTKVKVKLLSAQQAKDLRVCPFAFEVFGPTGCSKSNIVTALIKAISIENGFPMGDGTRMTMNEADKYESEMTAGTVVVSVDDMVNTKSDKLQTVPHDKIINIVNNVTRNATKADIGNKGNVPVQPKIFTVTTNVKDLNVAQYSNEPGSVLRRFNYILNVRLHSSHTNSRGTFDAEAFKRDRNAWSIDIEEVVVHPRKDDTVASRFHFSKVKSDCTLEEVMAFMAKESKVHFESQDEYIQETESEEQNVQCEHGCVKYYCQRCNLQHAASTEKMEEQAGHSQMFCDDICEPDADPLEVCLEADAPSQGRLVWLLFAVYGLFLSVCEAFHYHPRRSFRWYDCLLPNVYGNAIRSAMYWEGVHRAYSLASHGFGRCKATLQETFTHIYANHRYATQFGLIMATITGLLITYKFTGSKAFSMTEEEEQCILLQEFLDLMDHKESKRDAEESTVATEDDAEFEFVANAGPTPTEYDNKPDVWAKATLTARERVPDMHGAVYDQMVGKVARHMHLLHNKDTGNYTNAFPLSGNFWLVPTHAYPDERVYRVYLSKTVKESTGKHIHCEIDPSCWRRIPNTDFTVVQLASAGDVPCMLKYLPTIAGQTESSKVFCVSRSASYEHEIVKARLSEYKDDYLTKNGKFPGYIYIRNEPCYQGLCMSALVPQEACPCILGFHLYGTSKEDERRIGLAGVVTRVQVDRAIASFPDRFKILNSSIPPEKSCGKYYGFESPVHPKHPINFMRDVDGRAPSCELFGAHQGIRSNSRTAIMETPISGTVARIFGEDNSHGPPDFKRARVHWQKDLEAMSHPCSDISPELLNLACDDLKRKLRRVFNSDALKQIMPLDMDVITSGMDGIRGFDRLDLNTSVGFPLNRKKKDFATVGQRTVEGISEVVDYDPMFEEMMKEMEEKYATGKRAYPIFRACMKDEALPKSKDKIRVFAGGQLAFTMLVRKYFLPIVRMEHQLWESLEGCVGINAHGPEWSTVANKLQRFKSGKYVAGDYSKYDKKTSPMFVIAALDMYIEIARWSGNYSSEDLNVMRGIATDSSCPLYEYDGAFVMCFSSWVSGIPITVDGNNMMNSLYLRYAYYSILRDDGRLKGAGDFDTCVEAALYGDDNVMEVSDDAPFFHHTSIQKALARIGMKYTMADKESESVPYIPFTDVSFLKRKFVWNEDVKQWFAPLERASIFKSLHNYRKTKGTNVLPEEIASNAIDVAALEFFRHGRESYERDAGHLRAVVAEHDFLDNEIPTYEEQVKRYNETYIERTQKDEVDVVFDEEQCGCTRYEWGWEPDYDIEPVFDEAQAGETEEASDDKEATVTFTSSDPGHVNEYGVIDATRTSTENPEASLSEFFSRPALIYQRTWDVGATNTTKFLPWNDFFLLPRISNRINNYRLMRCRLHLRFVLNGNPFSCGRMLVSYAPFSAPDIVYSRSLIPGDAIAESQRMSLWLNPTNSTGGDLVLPFFFPSDNFDVVRADWSAMGDITMRPINPLLNTNGNADALSILVYAWAEDMYLDVPTSFSSANLSPQAGKSDEYGKGIVSRPASAVAHVASKLKSIPWIKPYATAAELAGDMVAGIASHFGYSRPAIVSDLALVDTRFNGTMAVGDTGDTSAKLTVDSKQALTVDPTVMGADAVDELAIAPFCGVESYLTTFEVTTANNPGDLLFSIAATPSQFDRDTPFGATAPEIYMTPMCAMAQCFEFWFGTINFRFMVVASNFHRARLRFVYDPGEATPTNPDYNTAFQEIVDIAETHEATFKVGWGSPLGMLEVEHLTDTTPLPFGTNPILAPRATTNGTLSVYLVTKLINPSDVDVPIRVNVLTSADKDIRFGSAMTTSVNNFSLFVPQEGPSQEFGPDVTVELEQQSGVEGHAHNDPADPQGDNYVVRFAPIKENDHKGLIYMGECVTSARQLLKRYVFQKADAVSGIDGGGNTPLRWATVRPVLVGFRGFDPNGLDLRNGSPANLTGTPFHNWFIPFFAGWKGSIRFKVFMEGDTTALGASMAGPLSLTRAVARIDSQERSVAFPANGQAHKQVAVTYYDGSGNGTEVQPMQHKGCVEAEIPYQRQSRFTIGRRFDMTNNEFMPAYVTGAIVSANPSKRVGIATFAAAGDDFTCAFFSGIPRLFYDPDV